MRRPTRRSLSGTKIKGLCKASREASLDDRVATARNEARSANARCRLALSPSATENEKKGRLFSAVLLVEDSATYSGVFSFTQQRQCATLDVEHTKSPRPNMLVVKNFGELLYGSNGSLIRRQYETPKCPFCNLNTQLFYTP